MKYTLGRTLQSSRLLPKSTFVRLFAALVVATLLGACDQTPDPVEPEFTITPQVEYNVDESNKMLVPMVKFLIETDTDVFIRTIEAVPANNPNNLARFKDIILDRGQRIFLSNSPGKYTRGLWNFEIEYQLRDGNGFEKETVQVNVDDAQEPSIQFDLRETSPSTRFTTLVVSSNHDIHIKRVEFRPADTLDEPKFTDDTTGFYLSKDRDKMLAERIEVEVDEGSVAFFYSVVNVDGIVEELSQVIRYNH